MNRTWRRRNAQLEEGEIILIRSPRAVYSTGFVVLAFNQTSLILPFSNRNNMSASVLDFCPEMVAVDIYESANRLPSPVTYFHSCCKPVIVCRALMMYCLCASQPFNPIP